MISRAIQSAAKKMMIDFEDLTSHIKHKGERGASREELFIKYLKGYFPLKFSMGRGAIIDSSGIQSKQQDCIIYDSFNSPILLDLETTQMVPIESVYATVEVKSTLNKTELKKCVENIKSVRKLPKHSILPVSSKTAGFVFAFTSDTSIESLLGNLIEFNQKVELPHQISMICILDKGLIVHANKAGFEEFVLLPNQHSSPVIISNTVEMNLMLFYLFFMQYLNTAQVFPPNLFKYADSENIMKVSWNLPGKHVPLDGYFDFDGRKIEVHKAIELSKKLKLMEPIQAGIATEKQLMDFFADTFKEFMELTATNSTDDNFIFFEKSYSIKSVLKVAEIYRKIRNGEEIEETEYSMYKSVSNEMYQHYMKYFSEGRS